MPSACARPGWQSVLSVSTQGFSWYTNTFTKWTSSGIRILERTIEQLVIREHVQFVHELRRHRHRHQHSNYLTADHTAADCAIIRTYTNTSGHDGQSVICSRYLLSMKFFEVGKGIVPQKRRKCSKKRL